MTSRKGLAALAGCDERTMLQWGLDADVEEGKTKADAALQQTVLQWGLDADVEEGERTLAEGARTGRLQWGLDADVEEGSKRLRACAADTRCASMGPRR